jgi:hypothetical protein
MPNNDHSIQYLKNIKKRLQTQELSVMVGAGFSKNVNNDLFPSWWQLLADMVKCMHEKAYEEDYDRLPKKSRITYKEFLENRIDRYIKQAGPLKVASNYMQLIGYRESLDAYIEAHTPFIQEKAGQKSLFYYNGGLLQDIPLSDEDLSTHTKLVNLPWNNIYTTNYDNLLEECVNADTEQNIHQQIIEQKKQITITEETVFKAKLKIPELEETYQKAKLKLDNAGKDMVEGTLPPSYNVEKEQKELAKTQGAQSNNRYQIERGIDELKGLEKQLSDLENQLKECAKIVTHSSQLALKKTRNIIKLHGSLRMPGETDYGFDNDAHKNYVITQEDFDTYPHKHEAFTQLMRISLLQESFCLIGFSGVDPNFLAWIGWVRDVLFRDSDKSLSDKTDDSKPNEKIYLIEPSAKSAEYNKITFYQNHRIAYLPLMTDECIDFLEKETGNNLIDKNSKKEILNLFFDYLRIDTNKTGPELAVELSYQNKFNQICDNLNKLNHSVDPIDVFQVIKDIAPIVELTPYNRIPSVFFSYDHPRYHFLRSATIYLKAVKGNLEARSLLLKVIFHLIRVQFYPHSVLFHDAITKFSELQRLAKKTDDEIYAASIMIDLHDAVWENDNKKVADLSKKLKKFSFEFIRQETQYLNALHEAISLKFGLLKVRLIQWRAIGHWKIKKAGLLSLIDKEEAKKNIKGQQQVLLQEHVYELELYVFLTHNRFGSYDPSRNELRLYKSKGLKPTSENLDYLVAEINKKEEKIKPYGAGKFSISNSFSLSKTNIYLQGMQLLGILMENGLPITYLSFDKTYNLLRNTIRISPFPVVFYALQYSNEELLKRLGQDIAFSDEAAPHLISICSHLHQAYLESETPQEFIQSIEFLFSELLIAISPVAWEQFFYDVWKIKIANKALFRNRMHERSRFVQNALKYIQRADIISQVIIDCLGKFVQTESKGTDIAIDFLYNLSSNPFLKAHADEIKDQVGKDFRTFIDRLPEDTSIIFVLGNLYPLLSESDKMQIKRILKEIDYRSISNARIWSVFIYFAADNQHLLNNIKEAIVVSPLLWNAGFTDHGVSSHSEYILLHKLRKNDEIGIEWTESEAVAIFNKLSNEFDRMSEWLKKRDERGHFSFILEEMKQFLEDETTQLRGLPAFKGVYEKVTVAFNQQKQFADVIEGLVSDDQNKVLWAIGELVRPIYEFKNVSEHETALSILVNKVLLQSQPALEASCHNVARIFYDFRANDYLRKFENYLVEILKRYNLMFPEGVDKPFIEEQLITIAFVLKSWGEEIHVVEQYLRRISTNRYNNIRFTLKFKLEGLVED